MIKIGSDNEDFDFPFDEFEELVDHDEVYGHMNMKQLNQVYQEWISGLLEINRALFIQ